MPAGACQRTAMSPLGTRLRPAFPQGPSKADATLSARRGREEDLQASAGLGAGRALPLMRVAAGEARRGSYGEPTSAVVAVKAGCRS